MAANHETKIELIDDPNLKRVYSNYVSITTAVHECNINFCYIDPTRPSPKVEAKIVAKLMIPNSLVEDFLNVIKNNYENTMKKLNDLKKGEDVIKNSTK